MSLERANEFVDAVAKRQEPLQLSSNLPVPLAQIQSLAMEVLYNAPSPFNAQSTRIVVLVGSDHRKLWTAIVNSLVYTSQREAIERNLMDAAGTLLFFEDGEAIEALQKQFKTYADRFPTWANQASGMAISAIWTALSLENVGACLHHYAPQIAAQAAGVPKTWTCTGQLVFGSVEKSAMRVSNPADDTHRFKVAKGDQ